MIDTGDKKIIVGDDIKIILKDDENDNKLEDIHKSDSLNHVQNNMDDVGKYQLVTFPLVFSIALIIYLYSVAALTGFIKWMILHITDSMKILTSEKGSPDDLQGSFVIISVILFSLMFNTSNTFNQNSVTMYLFLDFYIQKSKVF